MMMNDDDDCDDDEIDDTTMMMMTPLNPCNNNSAMSYSTNRQSDRSEAIG
jgi:hypothetical protein